MSKNIQKFIDAKKDSQKQYIFATLVKLFEKVTAKQKICCNFTK